MILGTAFKGQFNSLAALLLLLQAFQHASLTRRSGREIRFLAIFGRGDSLASSKDGGFDLVIRQVLAS
jgi:hypothetical protein